MKATAKSFFGTNLEQEVLDQVVINGEIAEKGTGTYSLPSPFTTSDFEWIEVQWCRANTGETIDLDIVTARLINSNQGTIYCNFYDGASDSVASASFPKDSTTWSIQAFTSSLRVRSVVGYKRRISRVGIDELMSAMSLPNLIANADLTDNPINQRGFDGNWAALVVGNYGYDQWMKVSSTHMGYVVEAGKYRPNTKHTFTKDDVVIGEFMSPASGHWTVAVPFATSGKFDLYAGQFKRPWHPVLDGEERCLRYFYMSDGTSFTFDNANYGPPQISNGSPMGRHIFYPTRMRTTTPSVSIASINPGGLGSHVGVNHSTRSFCYISLKANTPTGVNPYVYAMILRVDASITLAELNGQIIYLQ
ncbi:hypothetical protein BC354_13485 [Vibrio cholerae]|nr:hypothetical protein [Vibrio cholerae]RGP86603.1 hypothetical protein BC354_13485 [Vibrio cholerae]RGP94367.1 hypothetical protein BC352_13140 [Vibrio cholerae]